MLSDDAKKHLTNDQCMQYIRDRKEFSNKRGSLTGECREPGKGSVRLGNLPPEHHHIVLAAEFVVFSYDTPIAWYGPLPQLTLESVEEFLNGPGLDDLEAFLAGEIDLPRQRAFPSGGTQWQMPAVRYSPTTSDHQKVMWAALAYEKTWHEAEDHKAIPAPHYANTEYARSGYREFKSMPSGGERVGW